MSGRGRNRDRNPEASSTNGDRERSDRTERTERSRSPLKEDDLRRIVSETMSAQIPRLILETSKVVTEQISTDGQDSAKSFTAFSQEMKVLKQKQEEVAYLSKAASLKSDGILISTSIISNAFFFQRSLLSYFFDIHYLYFPFSSEATRVNLRISPQLKHPKQNTRKDH